MKKSIKSVICTLFEGHYHFGVAGLANSLYKHGFRGDIFIGYRGELPFWVGNKGTLVPFSKWEGAMSFEIELDLVLHFLPVQTEFHFTNYKPEFILKVWDCVNDLDLDGIFYFDPDIVNKCDWNFYERWIRFGVALVHEIVWNDMPPDHPKRRQWVAVADSLGLEIKNQLTSYINAGFVGVSREHIGFVRMWREFIEHSVRSFGFDGGKFSQSDTDDALFSVGDQDLLNLAAMCTSLPLSRFGPEGMDFTEGGWLMSHGTGSPKPWKVNFLNDWLKGKKPATPTKEYWKNANGVIKCYSDTFVKKKRFFQKMVSILCRFYSK